MPESTNAENIHFCQELWANATNKQNEIKVWIPRLEAQINEINKQFDEDSNGAALCDVAQQLLDKIEEENNKPLTGKPPEVPS